jgi:hypothetical protein
VRVVLFPLPWLDPVQWEEAGEFVMRGTSSTNPYGLDTGCALVDRPALGKATKRR